MKQFPIRKYDFKRKLKFKCLQNIRIVVIAITWCTWNLCADTRCVFHCLFNESKFAYLFADMKIHENKQGRGLSCLVILCTILWYLSISRNANINGVWWNVWVFSFHQTTFSHARPIKVLYTSIYIFILCKYEKAHYKDEKVSVQCNAIQTSKMLKKYGYKHTCQLHFNATLNQIKVPESKLFWSILLHQIHQILLPYFQSYKDEL